jgi:hypothetical protein
MLVSDIYDDFKAFGNPQARVEDTIRRISDAYQLLVNKSRDRNFANLGVMDVCVCDGTITLPRFVGTVLAINQGSFPTFLRSWWFESHYNGAGVTGQTPGGYADFIGYRPIVREPTAPFYLVAITETAVDNNKVLRVYGDDENDKPIYTPDATGTLREGFNVPTIYGAPAANSAVPLCKRITRVDKERFQGFVKLVAIIPGTPQQQYPIAYYEPGETEPNYQRWRVAAKDWCRIRYRRATMELTSMQDWVPFKNRMALILAGKSQRLLLEEKFDQAIAAEAQAVRYLEEEFSSELSPSQDGPQINVDVYHDEDSIGPRSHGIEYLG